VTIDRRAPAEIAPQSRAFLIELFTKLRADLAERAGEEAGAARELRIFDALLAGLEQSDAFPDDEELREYVAKLAASTDESNEYEHVVLGHRALAELGQALREATNQS